MSEGCTHDCSTCSSKCSEKDLRVPCGQFSNVKKVIGVVSGKGGVGKSLVTSLLASAMQARGHATAIMDADVTGPSIPKSFGLHGNAVGDERGLLPMESKTGIKIMSVNLLLEKEDAPVVWRGPVIAGTVKQFWTDVVWNDVDYMFVDNASMRMIAEPKFFDVMVTENTFGDILTDEGSCISGSMGLLPSASTGESTPVFEPVHGSWPQAKGQNIANPLAQILSVAMLLEYFDLKEEGALVREAVDASLDANVRTPEIQVEGGAKYGTKEVGEWIVDYIKNK